MKGKEISGKLMILLLANFCVITIFVNATNATENAVQSELVKRYDGRALRGVYVPWIESVTFDAPPAYAYPGPYPYEFRTEVPSLCVLKIRQALWIRNPYSPNTLEIFVDQRLVFSGTATLGNWVDGGPTGEPYFIDLGFLVSGLHVIELKQTYNGYYIVDWWEVWSKPAPLSATVGVFPETLSFKSMGQWVTVYIQLPEAYEAGDINAATSCLMELLPLF